MLLHSFHFQALVLAQLHVGADVHFHVEFQILAGSDLFQIEFRLIHGLQVIFLHRRFVGVRKQQIDGIVIENALAVQRFHHFPGSLALPEAGNADAPAHFQESLLHRLCKLVGGECEAQLGLVAAQFFIGIAHGFLFLLRHVARFLSGAEAPHFIISYPDCLWQQIFHQGSSRVRTASLIPTPRISAVLREALLPFPLVILQS